MLKRSWMQVFKHAWPVQLPTPSNDFPNHPRRQTDMPRHIKIGLIMLAIAGTVAMGFFVDIVGRVRSMVNEHETEENPFKPPTKPLYAPTDPPMAVKVFFPTTTGDTLLLAEDQMIFKSRSEER